MEVARAKDVKAQYEQGDIYIPRIKWTKEDNNLVVFWMNRHQDDLRTLGNGMHKPGRANILIRRKKHNILFEVNDDWWFLKDGKKFSLYQ
jgi:dipeptidyl-peptidase-4